MKKNYLIAIFALVFIQHITMADKYAKFTVAKEGSIAPNFARQTFSGENFSLSKEKGKVVIISFFAIGCRACEVAMPQLDKVYQKYKENKDFKFIIIGRGSAATLKAYLNKKKLSFPATNDPGRKIFSKYATKYIPRSYVVGRDGKVKFTSVGCPAVLFKKMSEVVQTELSKNKKMEKLPQLIVIK